jgi:geranylgeranyl diphosphate synthase type II
MKNNDIAKYLAHQKARVDTALEAYFANGNPLFRIMYYSTDRGKRIRPILAIACFEACNGKDTERIMPVACALELIHTYSLIHDDLPSMDNDNFRRGKPSAHKQFGEAMAILAGDGLYAYAFELVTQGTDLMKEKYAVVQSLSEVVGPRGIVYGQVLDLTEHSRKPHSLRLIHYNKTAKFIAVSLKCGAIMAQASQRLIDALFSAGVYVGMLFQYTDDILDVVGEKSTLGKTPGKDSTAGKLTAPLLYGLDGARFRAERYAQRAQSRFAALGERFNVLSDIAAFILQRTY